MSRKSRKTKPEPEVDAWLIAAADKAYHDKRYSHEEVKAMLFPPREKRVKKGGTGDA
ncbi:MAG: hypothetical protein WCP21_05625 [Armatimonadota bacterium]